MTLRCPPSPSRMVGSHVAMLLDAYQEATKYPNGEAFAFLSGWLLDSLPMDSAERAKFQEDFETWIRTSETASKHYLIDFIRNLKKKVQE